MYKFILTSLLLLFSTSAQAASDLTRLFETHFHTQYVNGRCGDNVRRFFQAAKHEGIEEGLRVVSIRNNGFSVFGMVNAERTRAVRKGKATEDEANWYHHAIAVDKEGNVYDFDFTSTPTILPFREWAEEMFLKEPECEVKGWSGRFCGGRKNKLGDYELSVTPADVFLTEGEESAKKTYLEKAYDDVTLLTR